MMRIKVIEHPDCVEADLHVIGGGTVAKVWSGTNPGRRHQHLNTMEAVRANAALFKAAPAMLAVLEAVVAGADPRRNIIKQANMVIRQAKGLK